ncbi:MAG TPA: ABC-three component system middle component 1 [Cellvibrio sp.]|nr:ABC-three component system middle component 1 [Cellvibrio sp.]
MNIYKTEEDISFLAYEFPVAKFSLYRSNPEKYLSCFVCEVEDSSQLESIWKSVTGVIAASYQAELDSKLEAWNIYLVFIISNDISKTLKYEIENNKFSMRKIAITACEVNGDITDYLNNEILGADLTLNRIFSYNPSINAHGSIKLQQKIQEMTESNKLSGSSRMSNDMLELAEWVSNNEI